MTTCPRRPPPWRKQLLLWRKVPRPLAKMASATASSNVTSATKPPLRNCLISASRSPGYVSTARFFSTGRVVDFYGPLLMSVLGLLAENGGKGTTTTTRKRNETRRCCSANGGVASGPAKMTNVDLDCQSSCIHYMTIANPLAGPFVMIGRRQRSPIVTRCGAISFSNRFDSIHSPPIASFLLACSLSHASVSTNLVHTPTTCPCLPLSLSLLLLTPNTMVMCKCWSGCEWECKCTHERGSHRLCRSYPTTRTPQQSSLLALAPLPSNRNNPDAPLCSAHHTHTHNTHSPSLHYLVRTPRQGCPREGTR